MNLKSIFTRTRSTAENDVLTAFYTGELASWEEIWRGGGNWRYTRKGGINGGTRKVAALNAAKALCAELSRLCWSEGTQLISADPETQGYLDRVLKQNRIAERFPDFLEKVFALGGGAIKVYWDGDVRIDLVTADCFVPTAWDNRSITGGAFGSRLYRNGKMYYLTESQEITQDGLMIENHLLRSDGRPADMSQLIPELQERTFIEGLTEPLFVYLRAGSGILPECAPLGSSVFAGAEDTLKSLDIVFDSLNREFILGKKRIIVPSYAVRGEYDENGDIKRYFDANDEVFQAMNTGDNEQLNITDATSELRVTEHLDAMGALLDTLCMQAGLSEGALSYKNGTIRTATEVISRNSRTYRTQSFYRGLISEALSATAQKICTLGKMAGALSPDAEEKASLMYADGVSEDESARTDRILKLYGAGLISKERALSQIYGIDCEQATTVE